MTRAARLAFVISLLATLGARPTIAVEPPPNAPATVDWDAASGRLTLRYHGTAILQADVRVEDAAGAALPGVAVNLDESGPVAADAPVEQRLMLSCAGLPDGGRIVVAGTVVTSDEGFAAELPGPAQQRFPVVRTSVGASRSLRNDAVYDRRWDWVLAGPAGTRIKPRPAAVDAAFSWECRGSDVGLVFRPRYYQKHREIANFTPWTYRVWQGPVTGYCTWWAYRYDFTEKTLDELLAVFTAQRLPDFGYRYVQLDDTYQIGNGSCPKNWLTWNEKFPGGAARAVASIRAAGMEPGVWVHRVHRPNDPHVADIGREHPDWFVKKEDGKLYAEGGFYLLDTTNPAAVEGMARSLFRELSKQDWAYVKIDGAGDLLYNYRNPKSAAHFSRTGGSPEQSLRDWDAAAREALGPDVYILTCWGVHPGLCSVGLVDGCRLGSDGFGPAGLQKFNSWNGVVWRNDPDHCDILAEPLPEKTFMRTFNVEQAPADAIEQPTLVSLAGGVLLVSDKVEAYRDDAAIEGMKRAAPVLFTVPGQLYDYGGRANRDHGAPLRGGEAPWWLMEIDRPFDHWSVLARFNWRREAQGWKRPGADAQEVAFADLGLDPDREYLVSEFWTQQFLGSFKGGFTAPPLSAAEAVQVFGIREARPHPWVLTTTRHVTHGAVCLRDVRWDAATNQLSGSSGVVADDPYVLTVHVPAGWKPAAATIDGREVAVVADGQTAAIRLVPGATGDVEWSVSFTR